MKELKKTSIIRGFIERDAAQGRKLKNYYFSLIMIRVILNRTKTRMEPAAKLMKEAKNKS